MKNKQMNLDLPVLTPHIGIRLRQAREERTLSPACVGRELKIQPSYVSAIEELNRDALPSIGYVLGYVRAYAGLVGLDGQEAVEAFKTDSEVPENLGMRDRPHFVPKRQIRLPKGFFAASTVMSCAAVLAFWYSSQTEARSSVLTAFSDVGVANTQIVETVTIDPDRLLIKAVAPSWLEIKDMNGKVLISRILVSGESWEGHRNDRISLTARDSGAFELYIGENLMGRLGAKGEPMAETLMPYVPPTFMSDFARKKAGLPPIQTPTAEISEN